MKLPGIGEVTAATTKAIADAEHIDKIRGEVEAQRDTITIIARDANKAREDINRVDNYAKIAKGKSEEAERAATAAVASQQELDRIMSFSLLITRANNDDRTAFDHLLKLANNNDPIFGALSMRAALGIVTSRGLMVSLSDSDLPRFDFTPQTATLQEYENFIKTYSLRPDVATGALVSMWNQERFSKQEKLNFLIDQINKTPSIRILESSCNLVNSEAKLDKNILVWHLYPQWWNENMNRYASPPIPSTQSAD